MHTHAHTCIHKNTNTHNYDYKVCNTQYFFLVEENPLLCLSEQDMDWNVTWPLTLKGRTAIQKCPGGAESLGMYAALFYVC